jgi:hypothetical protein
MRIELPDPTWSDRAECLTSKGHDPEMWFAPKGSVDAERAKNVCAGCPVAHQCLAYALAQPVSEDYGILGGLDEVQRRQRRRRVSA